MSLQPCSNVLLYVLCILCVTDLNECKKYRTLCANGRCVNKKGYFVCLCPPGQQFSYNSRRCVASASMSVCNRNPGICGNATCSSEGHSIRCLCPAGYDYDVSTKACKVISECDLPDRCGEGALCEDTLAGYRCVCTEGYIYNYQDKSCRDIPQPPPEASGGRPAVTQTAPPNTGPNECNSSPCVNGVCVDRPDGFICQCVDGYHLVDSVTCEDINECAADVNPCMYGDCVNDPPGSFRCECTLEGLTLDSTGRRCIEIIGPVSGGGGGGGGGGSARPEDPLGPCWGRSEPNQDICSNVVSQESTYQQCCCNTGFSWGKECYSCPLRNSEEYRMLCLALSLYNNQDGSFSQQADQPVPGIPRS
nr:latent-transforming growth factor beta-binding protein 1-like [Lytechinus pictus]